MVRRVLCGVGILGLMGLSIPAWSLVLNPPGILTLGWWQTFYTDTDYLAYTGDYVSYTGTFQADRRYCVELIVPLGADFDIYVYRVETDIFGNRDYILVASGRASGSSDEIVYFSPAFSGTYVIKVVSYRGSGWYTLKVSRWVS